MAEAITPVEAPRRHSRLGGINGVVDFIDGADRIALNGTASYVAPGCALPETLLELCLPADPAKTREGIATGSSLGNNFALYAGVECHLGGADYEQLAREALEAGEDRGLEAILGERLVDGAETADTGLTGYSALAALENHADGNYIGRPILWGSRADAVTLDEGGVAHRDGDGVVTVNGTPMVASGAISDGLFITGAVTIYRSSIEVNRVVDPTSNREYAIAERAYAVAVDCDYRAVIGAAQGV